LRRDVPNGEQLSVVGTVVTQGEPDADSKCDAKFGDGAEAGITDGVDSGADPVVPDSGADPIGLA
jgi:hypothetical protein